MKKLTLLSIFVLMFCAVAQASFLDVPEVELSHEAAMAANPEDFVTHKVVPMGDMVILDLHEYRMFHIPNKGNFVTASDSTFWNVFCFRPRTTKEMKELANGFYFRFTVSDEKIPCRFDKRKSHETVPWFDWVPDGPDFAVVAGSFRENIVEGKHFELCKKEVADGHFRKEARKFYSEGENRETSYIVEWCSSMASQRFGLWSFDEKGQPVSRYISRYGKASLGMNVPYQEQPGEFIGGYIINGQFVPEMNAVLAGDGLDVYLANPTAEITVLLEIKRVNIEDFWQYRERFLQAYADKLLTGQITP